MRVFTFTITTPPPTRSIKSIRVNWPRTRRRWLCWLTRSPICRSSCPDNHRIEDRADGVIYNSRSSILDPRSSILDLLSSILDYLSLLPRYPHVVDGRLD